MLAGHDERTRAEGNGQGAPGAPAKGKEPQEPGAAREAATGARDTGRLEEALRPALLKNAARLDRLKQRRLLEERRKAAAEKKIVAEGLPAVGAPPALPPPAEGPRYSRGAPRGPSLAAALQSGNCQRVLD
jgi:hypothetical protein